MYFERGREGANTDINVAKGTVPSPSASAIQSGSIFVLEHPVGENGNKAIRESIKLSGLSNNACALLLKVCAESRGCCNVQKGTVS